MERQLKIIAYLLAQLVARETGGKADEILAAADELLFAEQDIETKEQLAIEEIYKAYPSTDTMNGGRGLGKCAKNKTQIKALLKTHDKDYILYQISRYLQDCNTNGTFLKNFSTFLNNLPEYTDDIPVATPKRKNNISNEYAGFFNEQ